MVKVFTANERGKIEFTREELEALLNEVWNDGHNHNNWYWWTSPTITMPYYSTGTPFPLKYDGITITCNTERQEE